MPYSATHRQKVRANIIDSARRLFNQRGFDCVSINQIMAGAQLTHGSFYSYFASKSDLYAEVLDCFFTNPEWKNSWEGIHFDLNAAALGPQIVRAYLSRQHFEDIENSCPMVALPGDVARSGKRAQSAFEGVFKAMVEVLERGSPGAADSRRVTAQAVAALCIGGMVIARALADRTLADELRTACMAVALRMGGWAEAGALNSKRSEQLALTSTEEPAARGYNARSAVRRKGRQRRHAANRSPG